MAQDLKNKQKAIQKETEVVETPISVSDFAHSTGIKQNHRFVVEKKYAGEMRTLSQWQTLFEKLHSDLLPKI